MEEAFGENVLVLLGAMFAALVAGFFSFMSLVASKESKVSEFRQQWIDALRGSISCYISSLAYLSILYKHHGERANGKKDKFEMARDVEDVYAKVNESYNDIIFRINPGEKPGEGKQLNEAFLAELKKTRDLYNSSDLLGAMKACEPLRAVTKPLLKYEWKRVRSGELNYRLSKYFAAFVLLAGFVAIGLTLYFAWTLTV